MGLFAELVAMIGFAAAPGQANEKIDWPDLPTRGFLSGRIATVEDAQRGNAAFSMNGQSKGTLPISIPQYVNWIDKDGISHPMILIQAERAPDGSEIVGLRDFAGQETVTTLSELTLLGTGKPK